MWQSLCLRTNTASRKPPSNLFGRYTASMASLADQRKNSFSYANFKVPCFRQARLSTPRNRESRVEDQSMMIGGRKLWAASGTPVLVYLTM